MAKTDCPNEKKNMGRCNCSYDPCPRKGNCCECLHFHLSMKELPACCFPDNVERSYDRSFRKFVATYK